MSTPSLAMPDATPWRRARNVLAVRLDNLGDVVMTGPALAAIKASSPDLKLTLLASPSGAAAAAHLPMIDDVIRYEAPWMKSMGGGSRGAGAATGTATRDLEMIDLLWQRGFDAAVIFTVCTQSALPCALMLHLAGIPLRAAHARENPYDLLTHWVRDADTPVDGVRHEVRRQLDLAAALGFATPDERLVFKYSNADRSSARAKLRQQSAAHGDSRYFVVHPGATAESRRYPADRFAEAARALCESTGLTAVYVGAASEHGLVAAAQGEPSIGVSLAGQLALGELAALVEGAEFVLCNNSGPAHIAAAQGTPVVVLYALTNPQHTPWQVASSILNHDVPCRNCLKSICPTAHHGCLLGVSSSQVVEAALELMRDTRSSAVSGDRRPSSTSTSAMTSTSPSTSTSLSPNAPENLGGIEASIVPSIEQAA